jgi:hypothetical protein
MVTLDTEQKPERQHCGRRMCAICRRVKRDKGEYSFHRIIIFVFNQISNERYINTIRNK